MLEDPNGLKYTTDYRYDALDNLLLVSQGYCPNCRSRQYTYDALSRLTQATVGADRSAYLFVEQPSWARLTITEICKARPSGRRTGSAELAAASYAKLRLRHGEPLDGGRFERLEPAVRLRCLGQHVGDGKFRREPGRKHADRERLQQQQPDGRREL